MKCIRKAGILIMLLGPVLIFFIYIWQNAVNIPYMDDADLVDVVNHSKTELRTFLTILFRQQNDHRVVFSRLGVLLPFWITGIIDFRLTILIGYLNLVSLGIAIFLVYRTTERKLWYFLPVSLLLFSPIVYQVHLWSITAYQYTLSITFSLLALYFLQKKLSRWWWMSIPFSIAASLTNLDGLGTLPIALIWLLLQGRSRVAAYYSLFVLAYGWLFSLGFKLSSASQLSSGSEHWMSLLKSILAITGSLAKVLSDTHALNLSMLLGAAILLLYFTLKITSSIHSSGALHSFKRFFQFDLVEISFLRILASAVMIAIGRHVDGIENMVAIRFQVYSVSLVVIFYLFVLNRTVGRFRPAIGYFASGLALLVGGYSYLKYRSAVDYYQAGLKADTYNFSQSNLFLHQYFNLPDPPSEFYAHYRFPQYHNPSDFDGWKNMEDTTDVSLNGKMVVNKVLNQGQYKHYLYPVLQFRLENLPDSITSEEVYLMLTASSADSVSYLIALRTDGSAALGWKRNGPISMVGEIPDKIPCTDYDLHLCWKNADRMHVRRIGDRVYL